MNEIQYKNLVDYIKNVDVNTAVSMQQRSDIANLLASSNVLFKDIGTMYQAGTQQQKDQIFEEYKKVFISYLNKV